MYAYIHSCVMYIENERTVADVRTFYLLNSFSRVITAQIQTEQFI